MAFRFIFFFIPIYTCFGTPTHDADALAAKASLWLDKRQIDMALETAYAALSLLSQSPHAETPSGWGLGSSARAEALLVIGRALAVTGRYTEAAERLSEAVAHVCL